MRLWQSWTRYWLDVLLVGLNYVVVNMDETAIQHEYRSSSGYTVYTSRREAARMGILGERVKTSGTRGHCTLIAFIANDAALQPYLPQILMPRSNEAHPVSAADRERFAALPAPLTKIYGTSGWVSGTSLRYVLTLLRRAIHEREPGKQILVLMDACSAHCTLDLFHHAARLGLFVVLVPAGLTWLAQPLDVFVFGRLKARLREEHRQERRHNGGEVPANAWITITGRAVQNVIVNRDWSGAFDRLGFGPNYENITNRLRTYALPLEEVVARPLTVDEINQMVGRARANLVPALLTRPAERLALAKAAAKAAPMVAPPPPKAAPPFVLRGVRLGPPLPPPPE